jgi:octaprenyl-diphosphate synthase
LEIVKASGAIEYTMAKAKEQAQIACDLLTCLPKSEHRKALELLTEVAVARVS